MDFGKSARLVCQQTCGESKKIGVSAKKIGVSARKFQGVIPPKKKNFCVLCLKLANFFMSLPPIPIAFPIDPSVKRVAQGGGALNYGAKNPGRKQWGIAIDTNLDPKKCRKSPLLINTFANSTRMVLQMLSKANPAEISSRVTWTIAPCSFTTIGAWMEDIQRLSLIELARVRVPFSLLFLTLRQHM